MRTPFDLGFPPRSAGSAVARVLVVAVVLAGAVGAIAWFASRPPAGDGDSGGTSGAESVPEWKDVTAEVGIDFHHEAGARGKYYNPETFGPGGGWLDYDGDGWIDLLLIDGNVLEGELDPDSHPRLYRNIEGKRFDDVTHAAGLDVPMYGMGFVAADLQGDGDADIFLYGLHRSFLFINDGNGRFTDRTVGSGLESVTGWVASAALFDYDNDSRLDLFVGNYVQWRPELEDDVDCTFGTATKKYCPVAVFPASTPQLFRGRGDGTFSETTREAGLADLDSKSLGVLVEDDDRDGDLDIFVANDAIANFLLRNQGDGTFEDIGLESGFATDADGAALAGMGIDARWLPDDGPLAISIGNFSGEPATLHLQEDEDLFAESSLRTKMGYATLDSVTFGVVFLDENLDGEDDLLLANGHVFDVEAITRVPYRQRTQLFRGTGAEGRGGPGFSEVLPDDPDHFLQRRLLGRGLAYADYDRDGDLDFVILENQGPAHLVRNDLAGEKHFIRVQVRGTRAHRDAIGAEVTLRSRRGGREVRRRRTRQASSSYMSQCERVITFGFAPGEVPLALEVQWPGGEREEFGEVSIGREIELVEGEGSEPAAPSVVARPASRRFGPGTVALRNEGLRLLRAGQFESALVPLAECLRIDPQDFVAHRVRIVALERLGRRQDANAAVRVAARAFPNAAFLVSHFALVLRESGETRLGARFFTEAGRIDPRRQDVWIALGNDAFDRGVYDEAYAYYGRVLELDPDSIQALTNQANILTIRKEYERAAPMLERVLERRADYASALSTLGAVCIGLKDLDRAEQLLERALECPSKDETRLSVWGNLGYVYALRGDRRRAIEAFEKVLELDPDDRRARDVLERLR